MSAKRLSPGQWAKLRTLLWRSQPHLCIYCQRSDVKLTVDHLHPLARGGSNSLENLAFACKPCNRAKGSRSLSEFLSGRRRMAPNTKLVEEADGRA